MNDTVESGALSLLPAALAYTVAAACLIVGLVAGYVLRAPHVPVPAPAVTAVSNPAMPVAGGRVPTLADMKEMADRQAAPLLEKLKADPSNSGLMIEIGTIYHAAHQFSAAAAWFHRAAQHDPSNVSLRTQLAASLFRSGDPDAAIAQLNQALHYAPADANTLFNLGLIRWQGKHDAQGALDSWQRLLRSNPGLSADRKTTVQHLIAEAKAVATAQAAASDRSSQP
jgi:cytochrome c-type biogenesis protein CcmH/NrfG